MKYAVELTRTNPHTNRVERAWLPARGATPYRVTGFAERRAEYSSEADARKAMSDYRRDPEGGYKASLHPIEAR